MLLLLLHDGGDPCGPFRAGVVDLGRKNFISIKKRQLERCTANGSFDFADRDEDLSQWRACETTTFYHQIPLYGYLLL